MQKHPIERDSVVLIGNGPSLLNVDMKLLSLVPTVSYNRAFIAYKDWGFSPTYYVCIDRNALPQNKDDISRLIIEGKIKHFYLRDTAINLAFPKNDNVTYIHIDNHDNFNTNFNSLGMFWNVAAVSVQILAALGYRRFLLLGIDGNYRINSSAKMLETKYDLLAQGNDDIDHFRSDYHGVGVRFTRPNNEKYLVGWYRLAEQAKKNGLEIVNASPDSIVNCFKKLDFELAWDWFIRGSSE